MDFDNIKPTSSYLEEIIECVGKEYISEIPSQDYSSAKNQLYNFVSNHSKGINPEHFPEFKEYCRSIFESYMIDFN